MKIVQQADCLKTASCNCIVIVFEPFQSV